MRLTAGAVGSGGERERKYAKVELTAVVMVGVLPVMAVVAVVSPLAFSSPG